MNYYQKSFSEIQREKHRRESRLQLKRDLLFVAGILVAVVLLGLVGAATR